MLRTVLYLLLGLLALPYVLTPLYAVIDPPSTLMLWRKVTGQRVERQAVKLDRIAPALALSVLIAEDGRFCEHYGVDFKGLTPVQKRAALKRMNSDICTCGCKLTIAQCRINEESCSTSKALAAKIVSEIVAGKNPPPTAINQ